MPTGFLGSGKTMLLRHLLGHPVIKKTAVVINAFGEIGLNHLLVTKTDLAKDRTAAALEARLGALNPAAPRHRVAHGEIEPACLFNVGLYDPESKSLDVRRWLKAEAYATPGPEGHGHHHHDVDRHDARIRAFCISREQPLNWDRFNDWLEMLISVHGARLLRVKGLLNIADMERPVVIHGVQHIFHPPALLDAWPDANRRSQLVFITRDLKRETFEATLKDFAGSSD